jgi:hypothetical protein
VPVDVVWIIIYCAQEEVEEALKTLEIVGAKCNVKFKKKKSFACHHCRVLRQSFSVASVALLLAIDAELMVAS